MEQNIPGTTSVQTSSSLKIGQPEEQQQSISPAIDKLGSESASQPEPSADRQPSSTDQPSASPSPMPSPDDATPPKAPMRAEPEKPAAVDAAVAYCMQRYR